MRIVGGKAVYETLEEMLDPAHAALLVIDMQNDFCAKGGVRHQMAKNIDSNRAIIGNLLRLIQGARQRGVTIIYVQNSRLPGGRSDSGAWMSTQVRRLQSKSFIPYTVEGTWGQELIEELEPLAGEVVLKKYRSSAFHQTMLDQILKAAGVETVIIAGVVTEGCVLATWNDAGFHDYYTIAVGDCVASYNADLHEAALKIMAQREIVSTDDIARAWGVKAGTGVSTPIIDAR